jgi:hypothetical protein
MPRAKRAPRVNLRAIGLIDEAENFADALRLMGLGLSELRHEHHGAAVGANASEISKRLDALRSLLQSPQGGG